MSTPHETWLSRTLLYRVAESLKQGPAAANGEAPAPAPSGPASLDSLDAHLASIDAAHQADQLRARAAYVDLLARLAPPRQIGSLVPPAPPPGAHPLATPPEGPGPDPEGVVAILRGVGKTPEDLRHDVPRLVEIRRLADHSHEHARLQGEKAQAFEALKALYNEWRELERTYKQKIAAAEARAFTLERRSEEASAAKRDLLEYQYLPDEIRLARRVRGHRRGCFAPEPAREAAYEELSARLAAAAEILNERGLKLGFLERAFFPPEPEPVDNTPPSYEWRETR